jgi:D-tyrosyl-tRNA(Tyr) deacylase
MKLIVQRVLEASVEVENNIVGKIGSGVLVFLGIGKQDTEEAAIWLAKKLLHLRIFEDEEGKMNRSLLACGKEVLIVSQFTLYADCSSGHRPSFIQAAPPKSAISLYEIFIEEVQKGKIPVETGIFGAAMKVALVNDGPATFILER